MVMSSINASASYKKQDGSLFFDPSKASVEWTAQADIAAPSALSIPVADIINLQQTPASAAKAALRIVVQASTAVSPENHTFNFTSSTAARAEQEAITNALRDAITALKQGATALTPAKETAPIKDASGQSAAMAMASTIASGARAAESWYDDQKLMGSVELQQSLLKKEASLRERFEQSLREKPDDISNYQFARRFWSARLPLLRAHAIERSQNMGMYNVLAEVKPKIIDGATRLNLSKEQIQLIFNQHSLVKHVYNEVVPRLSETEFWSRFFVSRLFKKLKGERITDADATDPILDKYLDKSEEELRNKHVVESHIPHFIDLEGNEQNHSRKQGNQPDWTMRANKIPILRVLNDMSERIMSQVAPADGNRHAPIGMDEETYNQLRLQDLRAEAEEDRVVLTVNNQNRLFGGRTDLDPDPEVSAEARAYAKQNPTKILSRLTSDIKRPLDLRESTLHDLAITDDADDTATSTTPKSYTTLATADIFSLISQQRALLTSDAVTSNLTPATMASLQLTHNTTAEFLHYFWALLLAPSSPSQQRDLASLLTTLTNSLARIDAVAAAAETERQARIAELRRQAEDFYRKTGKRQRRLVADDAEVSVGGRGEVEALIRPIVRSIGMARERFEDMVRQLDGALLLPLQG